MWATISVGDLDLTAHGIDAHQRPFELLSLGKLVEEIGDDGNLIGLFRHAELCQRQPGAGGVGAKRMQGFEPITLVMVRLDVLPSTAMNSGLSGHCAAAQLSKQRLNSIGSIRLTRQRSQRSQAMP